MNPVDGSEPLGLCKSCGLKKAPEYDHSGQVSKGTKFSWEVEFLNDDQHDPKCCEVRQHIYWNRCWSKDRCRFAPFFDPPHDKPGNWYEDRDMDDKRYGRRDGRHSGPHEYDRYEGNKYFGSDVPFGPDNEGFFLRLRLVVIDRCRGDAPIYTSKTLQVNV
jgi:hypothetical protein